MRSSRIKSIIGVLVIALLLGYAYHYREVGIKRVQSFLNRLQPCQNPITYSIETLDPRFGLTKSELLDELKKGEKIWESPIGRQLFEYSPTGALKINVIYDYRQKATDTLRKMGIAINNDRSTYDTVKAKYDVLVAAYDKEKTRADALIAAYEADKSAYEKEVDYWNSRDGAPKMEYAILEQKRIDLNDRVVTINKVQDSLNRSIDAINAAEVVLNELIGTLNLQVSKYNTAGVSAGKEFTEGEYVSDASGTTINIFQYNDKTKLIKVIAHELGHALGLGHLDNPKAIMYYLNEGVNEKLTADDLVALKNICGIK